RLTEDYPMLPMTLYLEFARNGNRSHYEAPYFARRRRLNDLIIAECVEHKGRFMDAIIDGIVCICEETSWCFPAHTAMCSTGPVKIPFPSVKYPSLDLFAAETGSQIALALYLLREELAEVSPNLTEMMEEALLHRVVRPYLTADVHWMRLNKNDGRMVANWTPWCTMNCLLVLFTLAALPHKPVGEMELRDALQKAAIGMDAYYDAMGEDGCCAEGVRYYRHGVLSFFAAANLMNAVTGGALQPLFEENKFKNMAAYILHMHIGGEYYCNFNDCPQRPGPCGAEEYLFAAVAENEPMRRDVAKDIAAHGYALRTAASQNLFYHIEMAFAAEKIAEAAALPALQPKDVFYPSTGMWVARRGGTYLAVKGGHNNEPHNHNDVGTVTLFKNGEPVLIDIGIEAYSGKTFSDDRYSLWTMNSAFHNVMTFGEVRQFDGQNAAAVVLKREEGAAPALTLELAGAYPPEAGVKSWTRRVQLQENGTVQVEDTLDTLPAGTFLTLMTTEPPCVQENTIVIGSAVLRVTGAEKTETECCPVTDQTLLESWQRSALYRVKIFPAGTRLSFTVEEK
ncbi:MAG: heparinase II/III family protein, partial [Clostridia bacterium]|nr:heparinase II/III family protein [Clostridia bacterium]